MKRYLMLFSLCTLLFIASGTKSYADRFLTANFFTGPTWGVQTGDVFEEGLVGTSFSIVPGFYLTNDEDKKSDFVGFLNPACNVGLKWGLPRKWELDFYTSFDGLGIDVVKEISIKTKLLSHFSTSLGSVWINGGEKIGGWNVHLGLAGKKYFFDTVPFGVFFNSTIGYLKADYSVVIPPELFFISGPHGSISANGTYFSLVVGIVGDKWRQDLDKIRKGKMYSSLSAGRLAVGIKTEWYLDGFFADYTHFAGQINEKIAYSGVYIVVVIDAFNY